MSKLILPERTNVIVEPDVLESASAPEFFTDGAVCRFRNGMVHILAYRTFENCGRASHQHVVTWHMHQQGFDPSFVCAAWRWREAGPGSGLGEHIMH